MKTWGIQLEIELARGRGTEHRVGRERRARLDLDDLVRARAAQTERNDGEEEGAAEERAEERE